MRVPILDRVELEEPVSDDVGVSERVAVTEFVDLGDDEEVTELVREGPRDRD